MPYFCVLCLFINESFAQHVFNHDSESSQTHKLKNGTLYKSQIDRAQSQHYSPSLFFHQLMNVLVYSGPGTTTESVKHCIDSLRFHLSKYYAVLAVNETVLLNEPWMRKTSLLVVPGGADLPYCQVLNGVGNRKIRKFVKDGGKFMGFCAGGYYASTRCEFDVGGPLEVSGGRELGFYPGVCKGGAFKGFKYHLHLGAKAVKLQVDVNELSNVPETCLSYYNGGGVFIDSTKFGDVKVLARYADQTDIDDEVRAAIVHRKIGKGDIILSGPHPEFSPDRLRDVEEEVKDVVFTLKRHDKGRKLLLREMLRKLGLHVSEDIEDTTPKITPMYITSPFSEQVNVLWADLHNNLKIREGLFKDNNDTFSFENDMQPNCHKEVQGEDPVQLIKFVTSGLLPSPKLIPDFNIQKYFKRLFQLSSKTVPEFGSVLGYSNVISSTHTILEQNPHWLKNLPHGLTLTATTQIAGRGRGNNVWLNPHGVLPATILFKIPQVEVSPSFIVSLQYICGLALIEAILGYGSQVVGERGVGYENMPVRIKWPNDIYMLKPEYFNSPNLDTNTTLDGEEEKYVKVAGSLLSSQCIDGQFYLIWGGGINVSNEAPTTSLNVVLTKLNELRKDMKMSALPVYELETLLAQIVSTINYFYSHFKISGLSPFLLLYYKRWLHSDQKVVVSGHHQGESRTCIIKGITPEYGLLIAQDVNNQEVLHLQPDGNSFDLFKGLVYKKNT